MSLYSTQEKVVAICKEGERGTESVATPIYLPVTGDSNIDYKLNLIEDDRMRGLLEPIQPQAGTKEGAGIITVDAEPELIGDLLLSLMGYENYGAEGSPPYSHTFRKLQFSDANYLLHPSYSVHIDRGDNASPGIRNKVYTGSVVKSIVFTGNGTDRLTFATNWLARNEATSSLVAINNRLTTTWPAPVPFMFNETSFSIAAAPNTNVSDWNLTVDNLALGVRTFNGSQNILDVKCATKLDVKGGFTILFENEIERAKFIAGTTSALIITYTRGTSTAVRSIVFTLPNIRYIAFPFGEKEGLLASTVTFNAYYKISGAETALRIALSNGVGAAY